MRRYESFDVVRHFDADPTGIRDSTSQIQAAIDAAASQGGSSPSSVFFPFGTFLISNTLTWKHPACLVAPRSARNANDGGQTRIVWGGPSTGTMIETEDISHWHAEIENLTLDANGTETCLRYKARLDFGPSGPHCNNVQFLRSSQTAVVLGKGVTNGIFEGCRWDAVEGWCIEVPMGASSPQLNMFIVRGGTTDFNVTGSSGNGQGFLRLGYEDVTGNVLSRVKIADHQVELNAALEPWLPNEGDKDCALVAIGHNTNYVSENFNRTNVVLHFDSVVLHPANGVTGDCAVVKMSTQTDHVVVSAINTHIPQAFNMVFLDNTVTSLGDMESDGYSKHPVLTFGPQQAITSAIAKNYLGGKTEVV